MGKVMSLLNATPDGFFDGKYAIIDAEFYDLTHGLLSDTSTVAFGRNTFELFQDRWPPILESGTAPEWRVRMARALNDKQKLVYSSTLKTTTWNNSAIVEKIDAGQFEIYKKGGRGGLLTLGSLSLVMALTAMNLVDDYYFCIQPFIAGKGDLRLFGQGGLDRVRPLRFIASTQLQSGVHIIHYQRAD